METSLFSRNSLDQILPRLSADTRPRWGGMSARHMIEHLALVVRFSNGKIKGELAIPAEKAERAKARMLQAEWVMPMEFKAAFLPQEGLPALEFSSLEAAIQALYAEMADFYAFFAQYPDAQPLHPYFYFLNKEEWELMHHKHFLHHFKQFDLVEGL